MKNPYSISYKHVRLIILLAIPVAAIQAMAGNPDADRSVVTYEAYGAVGDGVADDLPAICKAHAYANEHGLSVRSKQGAIYHLGHQALTAIIATDTDWGTSRFIIDDSKGVENNSKSLFEVRSLLKPVPLKIERMKRGQNHLDLKLAGDTLVYVENKNRNLFIRSGLNQSDGSEQKEVFILRPNGSIIGEIDWDYDVITRIEARPIDTEALVLRGGIFTNIANRTKQENVSSYWARNILISRSKTVVDGVTHRVTGETDIGQPYSGFLSAKKCASIVFRNCTIDGRKFYRKIGNADKPVSMGTYGYRADLVVDFRMTNCQMGNDIHDTSRWGVVATNFMKNILVENCTLSRVDVHMGVSGSYIIRHSTLGHAGINAIGRGCMILEDTTVHSPALISFREDYGSTWEGEIIIRNSRWMPPAGKATTLHMFSMRNDGTHDYGYPCFMPRFIQIEGLFVDDSKRPRGYQGLTFFNDPIGKTSKQRPFPYHLTERLEVNGLKTASGLPPRVCDNPAVTKAVTYVSKSASPSARAKD